MTTEKRLEKCQKLFDKGLDKKNMQKVLRLLEAPHYTAKEVESFRLWNDYLPLADEFPYTVEQRNYHILWEVVDRVPLGINVEFAIPFRAMIAKKLFKNSCIPIT